MSFLTFSLGVKKKLIFSRSFRLSLQISYYDGRLICLKKKKLFQPTPHHSHSQQQNGGDETKFTTCLTATVKVIVILHQRGNPILLISSHSISMSSPSNHYFPKSVNIVITITTNEMTEKETMELPLELEVLTNASLQNLKTSQATNHHIIL